MSNFQIKLGFFGLFFIFVFLFLPNITFVLFPFKNSESPVFGQSAPTNNTPLTSAESHFCPTPANSLNSNEFSNQRSLLAGKLLTPSIEVVGNPAVWYTTPRGQITGAIEERRIIGNFIAPLCCAPIIIPPGIIVGCARWCDNYTCFGEWSEYRAESTKCGTTIYTRSARSVCGPPTCVGCCGRCEVVYGPEIKHKECGSWQVSKAGKGEREQRRNNSLHWGMEKPLCYSRGECIDKVIDTNNPLRLYDNAKYPTNPANPEKSVDHNNVFLPVKFDWDDVRGWEGGWVEGGKEKTCPSGRPTTSKERDECVRTYQIIIRGREPTREEEKKEGEFGTMRDPKVLEIIHNLNNEIEIEKDLRKRREHEATIKRLKKEELTITEYRVMIEYPENPGEEKKATIEYVKQNGNIYRGTIEEDQLFKAPLVRLGKSEIIVPVPFNPCFFKSRRAYELKIRACADAPETREIFGDDNKDEHHPINCGKWSEWQKFFTNRAPEPSPSILRFGNELNYSKPIGKKPFPIPSLENIFDQGDPDWAGKKEAKDQALTMQLRWCDVDFRREIREEIVKEEPKSFKLFIYLGRHSENNKDGQTVHHPWLLDDRPRILSNPLIDPLPPRLLNREYGLFTKPPFYFNEIKYTFYAWRVSACERHEGQGKCTDFSQKRKFAIKETDLGAPRLVRPPNNIDIPVGLPTFFEWDWLLGAKSYEFELRRNGIVVADIITATPNHSLDSPPLSLDTVYEWRVRACSDFNGKRCEPKWSYHRFRTTGRPPKIETMKPTGPDILIPTNFEWENVPGARSYIFRIQGSLNKELIIEEPKTSLTFPTLSQGTNYQWQVRSCARPRGELCGEWSQAQTFTTFKLKAPVNLKPENNTVLLIGDSHDFSWDLGARYHQFKLTYQKGEGEERQKCLDLEEKGITKILERNSLVKSLECRGSYWWKVRGCLDEKCTQESAGQWSNLESLILTPKISPYAAGLVPCGRKYDHPATQWVETDQCQPKHLLIMFYIILNFFLWTIIPLILVTLVVYSGVIFYLSLSTGTAETIPKVKALWRSAGIGLAIIFFAWIAISWTLTLFGYQVGLFGIWYRPA